MDNSKTSFEFLFSNDLFRIRCVFQNRRHWKSSVNGQTYSKNTTSKHTWFNEDRTEWVHAHILSLKVTFTEMNRFSGENFA